MSEGRFSMSVDRFKGKPKDGRTRNWTILVYPDSAPENWREVIAALHVPAYVSPLHDKDVSADGTPKKPHYHVILCFRGKKSVAQVQAISDQLSGVRVDWDHCAVGDLSGAVRYTVHFDDANKAQYNVGDIEVYGGADVMAHFTGSADVDDAVGEMMDWLNEQGVTSFAALARYARRYRADWFRVLTSKRTVFLSMYCKSLQWELEHDLPTGELAGDGEVGGSTS